MTGRTPGERATALVEDSGLRELNELASLEDVSERITAFAEALSVEEAFTQQLAQTEAVRLLKARKITNAKQLLVTALRNASAQHQKTHHTQVPAPIEPWPEPVNLESLLQDLCSTITRFVVLDTRDAVAAALWIVHTYCLGSAEVTPRLAVLSPTKRCGKTTLLRLLSALVCKPLSAANITSAAVYRVIDRDHPTLLIDEADTFLSQNEELRGVLNAGHTHGCSQVIRVDKGQHGLEPVSFDAWGAVAIAMIGR